MTTTPDDFVAQFNVISTYINYLIMAFFAYLIDTNSKLAKWVGYQKTTLLEGYAPLLKDFEDFYTRYFFVRVADCWNRPISSNAGAWIDVMERTTVDNNRTFQFSGKKLRCLNLASYNYLGFADNSDYCTNAVLKCMDQFGVASCSPSRDFGLHQPLAELETLVARFLGKEDAIVCGMGFATNSTCIPVIAEEGSLLISDNLNHCSIITGARAAGAKIRVFKNNDMDSLEQVIVESIVHGQPRTHRAWKKIIIMVEGIYSMEGETCMLREIVELKKKYRCYLYVDEAHSVGAMGPNGRGICDYYGVDPADVDVLMGTFSKSFGSVGGYVASNRAVINKLRKTGWHTLYGTAMPAPSVQQVISSMQIILGEDGSDIGRRKLDQLRHNSNFMRERLIKMGYEVLGSKDSPVIPVLLYNPARVGYFSRNCLARGLAIVGVGFPATSLVAARARLCMSAGHTIEDLEEALKVLDEVGDECMAKFNKYRSYLSKLSFSKAAPSMEDVHEQVQQQLLEQSTAKREGRRIRRVAVIGDS